MNRKLNILFISLLVIGTLLIFPLSALYALWDWSLKVPSKLCVSGVIFYMTAYIVFTVKKLFVDEKSIKQD